MAVSRFTSRQDASPAHRDPADNPDTYVQQLQSRNEELQVLNEELMVSNEELRQRVGEVQRRAAELARRDDKLDRRAQALDREAEKIDSEMEQLRQLKGELESATAVAGAGIVFVDRELCVQRYGGSAADLFHLREADLGRQLSDMSHELEHDGLMATIKQVVRQGEMREEEVTDGDGTAYLLRVRPYRKSEERVEGAVISLTALRALEEFQDRRERFSSSPGADSPEDNQLMDELLHESEQRYRQLFEQSQEGIMITAPEGTVIDVNPALCELSGYAREELIDRDAKKLHVYPAERNQIRRRLVDEGRVRGMEIHTHRRDGQVIVCRVSATAMHDGDGNLKAFQFYVQDITEQEQAREALRESERKFRELAEQSLLGIGLIQDGTFQYVNPRMGEMFGYEMGELLDGKGPVDLVHPDDWPRVQVNMQERLSGRKKAAAFQTRGLCEDGEVIDLEVHSTRILSGGEPALLGYVLDVSERRHLERELLNIQEEERRRIGQDLHDTVASQLTGISLILSSYKREVEEGGRITAGELGELLEMAKQGERQTRELSHGLHPGKLSAQTLQDTLGELVHHISRQLEGRCIYEAEDGLPCLDEDTATQLFRIAQEAATNALRHGDPDALRIELARSEEEMVLIVEDDGHGFAPEETSEGLGLSSMRYRAELIGAVLTIDAALGEGTTMRCRLPVDAADGTATSRGG